MKFDFQRASDEEGRFYIYGIWNRKKDKYYVGISRNPEPRINDHLRKRLELSEDYARAAESDSKKPEEERTIQWFCLGPPNGYTDILIGCLAEVLHMAHLEKQGKHLYNRNKFGGHHKLKGERRLAFEGCVKIILRETPSEANMQALRHHIGDIKTHAQKYGYTDIVNQDFIDQINDAWDAYQARKDHDFKSDKQANQAAFWNNSYRRLRQLVPSGLSRKNGKSAHRDRSTGSTSFQYEWLGSA